MSVIIAIFQAIFQALTYILPISESGHTAVFRDFAGRADATVGSLTGAIHIGIALGIFAASLKFFLRLGNETFKTGRALIKREYSFNASTPNGKLVVYCLVSFLPMLLWLIPLGGKGNLYGLLKSGANNNTLLDEGVLFAVLGALLLASVWQLGLKKDAKFLSLPAAAVAGVCSLFLVPVSGLSLIGGVFAVLVLFGVGSKLALKYSFLIAVPVLLVSGIAQIITADYRSGVIAAIIGVILSAALSFLLVRILSNVIKKGFLKYISYYDISLGAIVAVIGIVQLIVR